VLGQLLLGTFAAASGAFGVWRTVVDPKFSKRFEGVYLRPRRQAIIQYLVIGAIGLGMIVWAVARWAQVA
jgi:hypothetical protein